MGGALFAGCLMISNGPNLALFWVVSSQAHLLIVMVASSFFWLVSLMMTALLATIIPPLTTALPVLLPLAVLLQEAFRYLYFQSFKNIFCQQLRQRAGVVFDATERVAIAVASGLGVAICHSMTFFVTMLVEVGPGSGPGSYFTQECPHTDMFTVSAVLSCCFSVLHIALMVIAFHHNGNSVAFLGVTAVHLLASLLTLGNRTAGGCKWVLCVEGALAAATAGYAMHLARLSVNAQSTSELLAHSRLRA